ncbi:hypothetical protein CRYUN_Cryun28dG0028300 [Craigia yunnanensis]
MSGIEGDKYRSYLHGEGEQNIKWRHGAPPNYDVVNKLFEDERTKVWPPGSLEEKVQNLVKTWEMELFHKSSLDDFKSMDTKKFEFRCYDPDKETAESSHRAFITTFRRGFALEVLKVYTGPPEIVYKFRHWGYNEGPFKGHAPTGELVEFYGMGVFEVDEEMKLVKMELFYDRGELLGGLLKGATMDCSALEAVSSCPILRNTG